MILGYSGRGKIFRDDFVASGHNPFVIDRNPYVVEYLNQKNIASSYGDITNPNFFDELDLDGIQIVVSGSRHFADNLIILDAIKKRAYQILFIVGANKNQEALALYERGADYVALSLDLGSLHSSELLEQINTDISQLEQLRAAHIKSIKNRHAELLLEELKKK